MRRLTKSTAPIVRAASAAVAAGLLTAAALAAAPAHGAISAAAAPAAATSISINKQALLHPSRKYYGVSVAGAPGSLSEVVGGSGSVTSETGKQPNLLLFYESWGGGSEGTAAKANINTSGITNACNAGLLPMLTWESWNTSARSSSNPGVAYTQTAFNMKNIIAGDYNTYIRATAKAIAAIKCPVALRFDQEQNGYWYPWGESNTTENGKNEAATARDYRLMWRHVWRIFASAGAKNVLWTWSPNWQSLTSPLPALSKSYPGPKYVDWVAVDNYYSQSNQSFAQLFDPTIKQLAKVAPKKPWMVGETAVGSTSDKPAEIANLLHNIAKRPRFNGFVYFDQHKSTDRSYWPFQQTSADLAAFKKGIASSKFAAGHKGGF